MITFETNAPEIGKELERLRTEFPKEFRRGMSTLGIAFRGRIKKALKQGLTPDGSVPELAALTLALRKVRGQKVKGHGGKLQDALRYKVTGRGAEITMMVGFTASQTAAKASQHLQESGQKTFTPEQKRWLIGLLIRAKEDKNSILETAVRQVLRVGYLKPSRSFVAPFEPMLAADAPRIVKGRIDSIIRKAGRK